MQMNGTGSFKEDCRRVPESRVWGRGHPRSRRRRFCDAHDADRYATATREWLSACRRSCAKA